MTLYYTFDKYNSKLYNNPIDLEDLKREIERFFNQIGHKPKLSINGAVIKLDLDIPDVNQFDSEFDRGADLCANNNFHEAKIILNNLIAKNPLHSEAYRCLGQMSLIENKPDESIDFLIDALRTNPTNTAALILLGNVYALHKKEIESAMIFYKKSIELEPSNFYAINNIASALSKLHNYKEAEPLFLKVLSINPDFENSLYGLALLYYHTGRDYKAFENFINLQKIAKDEQIKKASMSLAIESANKLINGKSEYKIIDDLKLKLEERGGIKIQIIEDESINTATKIEYSWVHNKQYHVLKYKKEYPSGEHLILHELIHLELVLEAKEDDVNQYFVTDKSNFQLFKNAFSLKRSNSEKMDQYIFNRLNQQIFNTPIDFFIEHIIYNRFSEFRPNQFLSLFKLNEDGIRAVTNEAILDNVHNKIISLSRIFSLINALLFKQLYGIDLIYAFKPSEKELEDAEFCFKELDTCKENRMPGEEYDIILHFAKSLNYVNLFQLIPEADLNKSIEKNNSNDFSLVYDWLPRNEKQLNEKQFLENNESGENLKIILYMVASIRLLKKMNNEDVLSLAKETALKGSSGYNPQLTIYSLEILPDVKFNGLQMMVLYFASFAFALPQMVSMLGLNYMTQYEKAKQYLEL